MKTASPIHADSIALRPAAPIEPALVARLIEQTDPHIFGAIHGHDAALTERHLGAQWLAPDGIFSHSLAHMAVHDDDLVGIELGFDLATQRSATGAMFNRAVSILTEAELARFAGFFEYGTFLLPPVPADAYYLQHLAVVDAARGRGIGERLLHGAFDKARARGLARVHLDVYEGNPAIRLYERNGMKTIVRTRVEPLADDGIPEHLRLELRL